MVAPSLRATVGWVCTGHFCFPGFGGGRKPCPSRRVRQAGAAGAPKLAAAPYIGARTPFRRVPWGTEPLGHRPRFDHSRANDPRRRQAASRLPAAIRSAVPPGGRELVRRKFRRADPRASRSVAGDQGRTPHPHRRADRIGQDARGLSCRRSTISCGRASKAPLADATQVVYVSPLKALSNDIHRNLEAPLAGVREQLSAEAGSPMSKSAPGSAPATRPPPSATGCAAARRTSW